MHEQAEGTPLVEVRLLDAPETLAEPPRQVMPLPSGQRPGAMLLAVAGLLAVVGSLVPLVSLLVPRSSRATLRIDYTAWGPQLESASYLMIAPTPQWGIALSLVAAVLVATGVVLAMSPRFGYSARLVALAGFGLMIGVCWQVGAYLGEVRTQSEFVLGARAELGPGLWALLAACLLAAAAVLLLAISGRPRAAAATKDPVTIPTGFPAIRLPADGA
ncbi:hypothetical protein [Kutzneria albida]|uniref:Uncharacterized protein n=1 Tax=Kutzneria albida DSM 43870 TaxID=1449976 RepID=W5WGJ6_9PSEU|nr:hypothetical protein [Kutzneria albida]AHH99875.1 hypothetical protein KALB_6516 [Kutzneria albida DSM 43870]